MTTASDALDALSAAHAALVAAQDAERRAVHHARAAGVPWEAIAERVGLTVTGAHYRYRDGAPPPSALPGQSVRAYARAVPESANHIAANLDQYEHVTVEYRGQKIVRILGKVEQ